MSHALHPAQIAILSREQPLPALATWAVVFAVLVTKWDMRIRTRRALRRLEAHELDDIGMTAAQASAQAHRPFWKA